MRLSLFATLLVVVLLAPAAVAQTNSEGLYLHLGVGGQSIAYDGDDFDDTDEGGVLALRAGYGVSPLVTLYVGATGARLEGAREVDDYDLSGGEVGARFTFRDGRRVRPVLDLALRSVTARDDETDFEVRGGGLSIGGGLLVYLNPTLALGADIHVGAGRFDEVEFGRVTVDVRDEELDYVEARVTVGLTAYPFR
ncbi:MAG: hypothetical protein CL433_13230 [Acidimicrobiaceae bacterium]|mgnify:CR=1 FL=1|nr:hypothetical protein [Acidimicrobiaceae bacterium]